MRELVIQAGNTGTQQDADLQSIQDEIDELNNELDAIAGRTEFNGKKLLDGSYTGTLQIGANATQNLSLTINSGTDDEGFTAEHLTVDDIDVSEAASFEHDTELAKVDAAIAKVSAARSSLGANQNRLEHTINNLSNASENLTAAESRIRDVDYT